MPEFEITEVAETPYAYVEKSCSMDPDDIGRAMGEAFGEVWGVMQQQEIAPAGGGLSVYHTYDEDRMTFRVGFVIGRQDMARTAGNVKADVTPAGRVVRFVHKGPYRTLRDDYGAMTGFIAGKGLTMGAPAWEVYLNDPDMVPEDELLTEVFVTLA